MEKLVHLGPQGVAVDYFFGCYPKCHKCGIDCEATLPDIIDTEEMYYHGHFCKKCGKELNESKEERIKFIEQKDKEKIERDKARIEFQH